MIRAAGRLTAVLVVFVALAGCAEEPTPLVVWSNTIDAAFFVERYNAVFDRDARFVAVDRLTEAITQQPPEADVIIGRWIRVPSVNALMMPVREYAETDDAATTRSRSDRIRLAVPDDLVDEFWIPLSFTLPTIVFDPERARLPDGVTTSLAQLGDALQPNDGVDGAPFRFVASADPPTVYALMRSLGTRVRADPVGDPAWEREALQRAATALRDWQAEWNVSPSDESLYRERYLYERWQRHLETERLLAVYLPSNEAFTWRFFAEPRYDFRILAADDGSVAANEDVVYAGIPLAAERRAEATRFIEWLTTPAVQVELVADKLEQRVDTFGLFGGLSTIPTANRAIFSELYPTLAGRVPSVENVAFPDVLPRYWDEALEAVVLPTLLEQFGTAAQPGATESVLRDRLDRWYLQRGD